MPEEQLRKTESENQLPISNEGQSFPGLIKPIPRMVSHHVQRTFELAQNIDAALAFGSNGLVAFQDQRMNTPEMIN